MAKGLSVRQAIFTSVRSDRTADYQIVAASPGIDDSDCRELAAWGPSHDALLDSGPGAASVNFFPLPSGSFCISRTTPMEKGLHRRGGRTYTHCLIATPEALRQFDNHPLVLLDAALPEARRQMPQELPARLDRLDIPEAASAGGTASLAELTAQVGPAPLAMLVQAALTSVGLAVRGPVAAERLIRGLLDCLPVDCRTAISFSTGLKFSPRRPFDVYALPDNGGRREWLVQRPGTTALDLGHDPASAHLLVHEWARLIYRLLLSGSFAFLSAELARPRPDLALADLPALGLQLLEEFESATAPRPRRARPACPTRPTADSKRAAGLGKGDSPHLPERPSGCFAQMGPVPLSELDAESPEVVARLEALDDAVFDAMRGNTAALADLRRLWPALRIELGDALLAESREHYIGRALSLWQEPANIEGDRDPGRAVCALEVLCVLFDDVP